MYDLQNIKVYVGDVELESTEAIEPPTCARKLKWWRDCGDYYVLITNDWKEIRVSPSSKRDFYDKHLKNIEDNIHSPFSYKEK